MSSSEAPAVTYTPLADAGSDSNAIETFVVLSTSPPSDRDGRWRRKKARQKEKKRIDSEIAAGTIKEFHPDYATAEHSGRVVATQLRKVFDEKPSQSQVLVKNDAPTGKPYILSNSSPVLEMVKDGRHIILRTHKDTAEKMRDVLGEHHLITHYYGSCTQMPAALPQLIPRLVEEVKSHMERSAPAGGWSGFRLVCEPSMWDTGKGQHALDTEPPEDFPKPGVLHRTLIESLSKELNLPFSRSKLPDNLKFHLFIGRYYSYLSFNHVPRMRTSLKIPEGRRVIHCTTGEVHLKLGYRDEMLRDILSSVRYRLKKLSAISYVASTFIIVLPAEEELFDTCVEILRTTPGISKITKAYRVSSNIEAIDSKVREIVKTFPEGTNEINVVARSAWKEQFPSNSELRSHFQDMLYNEFGIRVFRQTPAEAVVPQREITVRISTPTNTYVGYESFFGMGGLPSKKVQSVVSLLSGGMDSPVASYMMMKRGCQVILVHFQNHLQMESAVKDKILRIAKRLNVYQHQITLYIVPFAELQAEIIERVPGKERMLVYRRFMTKIASRIADRHQAKFLVLGDSFSQVASQTVMNLHAIYERSEKPILAPLMGWDKEETMKVARETKLYDLSALPYGDCCSYFMDAHPALHLRGERVPLDDYMAILPSEELEKRALAAMEITKLTYSMGVVTSTVIQQMSPPEVAPHLQAILDKELQESVCVVPDNNDTTAVKRPREEKSDEMDIDAPPKKSSEPVIAAEFSPPAVQPKSRDKAIASSKPTTTTESTITFSQTAENDIVYLDAAATTPLDSQVLKAMLPYLTSTYGNPNSLHTSGKVAANALTSARRMLAATLGSTDESEVIFTSGGTESNNLAINGFLSSLRAQFPSRHLHIITSTIEHAASTEPIEQAIKRDGNISVTMVKVDGEGFVTKEEFEKAITKDTVLFTLIHGNNEIGTIQNVSELGKICRDRSIIFHIDACQSYTKTELNVKNMNLDMVTLNGHKIHGPKGVGALWVRRGVKILAIQGGGGQEGGIRGGTINVPGVVGLAVAADLAIKKREVACKTMKNLTKQLYEGLKHHCPFFVKLNGPVIGDSRLSNNLSIQFDPQRVESDMMLRYLSSKGVCCSSGSACSSEVDEPSHVLLAIGRTGRQAKASLRFSITRDTKESDITKAISIISSYQPPK